MTNPNDLIDRYFAMWNETNAERRRDLIAATWADDARYVDPMLEGEGRKGIDAMVAAVHQRFPGLKFRRTGKIDLHHDRVRFSWELAPDDGPVFADGVDFGVLAADGRLRAITGFIDHAPAQPAAG
ncbi:MAG: nuclear transport factor 2 family protein [Hyphomicrobiales bacterium]